MDNCQVQIAYTNQPLTGLAPCGKVFGINNTTGILYYRNFAGIWAPVPNIGGGSSGLSDATVMFSGNVDPNTPGVTFLPNTPSLTTVVYVSTIDYSVWVYDSGSYHTHPDVPSGLYLTGLSGDVTTTGTGLAPATLATVNADIGTFTNSTVTVNAKGLVTAVSSGVAPVTVLGPIGNTPNANGATITGNTLNLQVANQFFGGLWSTTAQSFSGNKTLINALKANKLSLGTAPIDDTIFNAQSTGTVRIIGSTTSDPSIGAGRVEYNAVYGPVTTGTGWRWGLNTGGIAGGYSPTLDFTIDELGYPNSGQFVNRLRIQKLTGNMCLGYGNTSYAPVEILDINGNLRLTGGIVANNTLGISGQVLTSQGPGQPSVWAASSGGSGAGTVTSVSALTLGTIGTDLNSSVANPATTPVITLNVPTASALNRGALSSSDWSTFNNKQDALTLTTTGTTGAATLIGTTLNIPQYALSTIPLSSVTGSVANTSINNANNTLLWNWATLTAGAFDLTSNSTASLSNSYILRVSRQGSHASAGRTTYGLYTENTHTGSTSTNVAGFFSASGGTSNYALIVPASGGLVGIGTSSPSDLLHANGSLRLGTSGSVKGILKFSGDTSGTVTVQPASTSGTWSLTLPTTPGTSGQALTTDGAGITTWTTITSGSTINFADAEVPSGVMNSINPTFTIANTPTAGSLKVYLRGLRLKETSDYTLSGTTITMIVIPDSGDSFIVDYRY